MQSSAHIKRFMRSTPFIVYEVIIPVFPSRVKFSAPSSGENKISKCCVPLSFLPHFMVYYDVCLWTYLIKEWTHGIANL